MTNPDRIVTVILVIFLGCGIGLFIWAAKHGAFNAAATPRTYSQPEPEAKPFTKTRCDLTGVMASSIIKDERANGYRFDGRVHTFLCGDNGLSFSLIQEAN